MIAPWLRNRDGAGGRERVLERAGRVQVCRKGHHSPATRGKIEECYFSYALVSGAGFGCPAEPGKRDGMAQKGPFWEQTVQKESSPSQSFPQHLILQTLSVIVVQSQHRRGYGQVENPFVANSS